MDSQHRLEQQMARRTLQPMTARPQHARASFKPTASAVMNLSLTRLTHLRSTLASENLIVTSS